MELRPYQVDCISKMRHLKPEEYKVVKLPTGSGKTVIMAGFIKQLPERILIVVKSTELREQTIDKLKFICGEDVEVGSVQGKLDDVDKRIIVATRQSLTYSNSTRVQRMLSHGPFKYILIDEAHEAVDQQKLIVSSMAPYCNNMVVIGFTATPYNQDLRKVYTGFVYKRSLYDMIIEKYLVEPRAIHVDTNVDISSVRTVAGEFNLSQLQDTINTKERNQLIVETYNKYAKDRRNCLVFATGLEHCDKITAAFRKAGINAYSVDSSVDAQERAKVISDFQKNKIKVLVNVGVLTTGFDKADLSTIIMARPTKSRMLFEQIIGRALRLHPTKEEALIIDMVDNSNNHDLMSLSDVFRFPIKSGETPSEAVERIKKLEETEQLAIKEAQKKKEEEEKRQMTLFAQEVALFNKDPDVAFENCILDWFQTHFKDTYALLATMSLAYVITFVKGKNKFLLKEIDLEKNGVEILEESYSLFALIQYAEMLAMRQGSNFCRKESAWKMHPPTTNQLQYIQQKQAKQIKTKWDATKYFFNKKLNLLR